jgi:hypothetical protein
MCAKVNNVLSDYCPADFILLLYSLLEDFVEGMDPLIPCLRVQRHIKEVDTSIISQLIIL